MQTILRRRKTGVQATHLGGGRASSDGRLLGVRYGLGVGLRAVSLLLAGHLGRSLGGGGLGALQRSCSTEVMPHNGKKTYNDAGIERQLQGIPAKTNMRFKTKKHRSVVK